VNTKDALLSLALDARKKATYFEQRAGRETDGKTFTKAAPLPPERAAAERKALAFLHAASVIEAVAEKGSYP